MLGKACGKGFKGEASTFKVDSRDFLTQGVDKNTVLSVCYANAQKEEGGTDSAVSVLAGTLNQRGRGTNPRLLSFYVRTDPTIDFRSANGLASIQKRKEIEMQAYCMKCRTKREMKDAKAITMKNGKPATQGVCPVCGTKMFRIGKS